MAGMHGLNEELGGIEVEKANWNVLTPRLRPTPMFPLLTE